MARQTHLREREVARVDRLWPSGDTGAPLLVSFYLTEVEGCVRCVGYAVRTFLSVATTDDKNDRYEVSVPLPRNDWNDSAEGSDQHDALRANGELPALLIKAHKELGEPFPINATAVKALPFGHLLDLAIRERMEYARGWDEALRSLGGRVLTWEDADGQESTVKFSQNGGLNARELDVVDETAGAGRHRGRRGTGDRPSLERIANLYEAACRDGSMSPTRDVTEALQAPYSTVAKRIMKCREAGLLGPTRKGQAGGLVDSEGGTP